MTRSALDDLLARAAAAFGDDAQVKLAAQIAYTLRYQHDWTELRIHQTCQDQLLPVPMISGLPPHRLYVHPDEQIELLQKQKESGKTGLPEMPSEREWVLPTDLRDKWSLQRFSSVFDVITVVPDVREGQLVPFENSDAKTTDDTSNSWRKLKRVALATQDDDSTVVFYIVHDGMVKPRQN